MAAMSDEDHHEVTSVSCHSERVKALLLFACLACLPACTSTERRVDLGRWDDGAGFSFEPSLEGEGPDYRVVVSLMGDERMDPRDIEARLRTARGVVLPLRAEINDWEGSIRWHGQRTYSFQCFDRPSAI